MKKKIAIIGAGISGLVFANLLKQNSKFDFVIFEKNPSLNLNDGYGIQLSVNSTLILNKIGFKNFVNENKFFPKKIDFYSLKNNNKICDLDITQFNSEDAFYTTLKRSLLIKFFEESLLTNSIQFSKKIKKINYPNSKVEIVFENSFSETFDYLVVSDGVFSKTKSILFNEDIYPKYFGALAIRILIKKNNLKLINKNNISIFLGPNVHLVMYPLSNKDEINLITIIKKKFKKNILNNNNFFNNEHNVRELINESLILSNNDLMQLFNDAKDLKCFPIFTTDKIRKFKKKNIFFLGDALYALPPTLAQGASQSIESAYQLFNVLKDDSENNFNKYYINRSKRIKIVNYRSKLNYFIFHLSNPIFVLIRNLILKMVVNNKRFLNKYLNQIYFRK